MQLQISKSNSGKLAKMSSRQVKIVHQKTKKIVNECFEFGHTI